MKQFYSCTDVTMPAPQPEQHIAANSKANAENGQIISYGAEDIANYKNQMFILVKLKNLINKIHGVIFFTIDQFCYSDDINLKLIKKIIDLGLEIHFSRENISIRNIDEFHANFESMLSYSYTKSASVRATLYKISRK